MPIMPYVGMVDQALRFKALPPFWMCLAITSPWPDDANPPNENDIVTNPQFINMTSITQPIAFKKVDEVDLCVPDASGAIVFQGTSYSPVAPGTEVTNLARWVNIRASINFEEKNSQGTTIIGNVTYRQYVLCSGLTPTPEFQSETVLAPNQVADIGRIVLVNNISPITHSTAFRQVINFIRECRG